MASYLKHDVSKRGKLGAQYRHDIVGMLVKRPCGRRVFLRISRATDKILNILLRRTVINRGNRGRVPRSYFRLITIGQIWKNGYTGKIRQRVSVRRLAFRWKASWVVTTRASEGTVDRKWVR
jgi:hypothetical protein